MLDADLPTTTLQHRWEPEIRKERLGNFIRYQCWRAKCLKTAAAAKFPQLAACENELMELLGDRLRLIICDRPLEESILSLQKRFPEEIPMQVAAHQKLIAGHIESLVKKVPAERVLRVEYTDLIHDIRPTVDRIAQFIRPEATEQERQAAAAHIQPKLRHIVIDQN